jgi:hypothetical protein
MSGGGKHDAGRPHIETFLRKNLACHRGASQYSCDSYGYSFRLLLEFAATRLRTKPLLLSLELLDSELVSVFLEYLEDTRRNATETRLGRWRRSQNDNGDACRRDASQRSYVELFDLASVLASVCQELI